MTALARLGALLVLALGASACTGADAGSDNEEGKAPVVQLGAPGESGTTLSPDEVEELSEPLHTQADLDFVAQMIPHHQQALDLTALVADRAADPALAQLAERIEVSQTDEIGRLEDWLVARQQDGHEGHDSHGDDTHDDTHDDHADMPGMLTEAQLDRLAAASGKRFDRLFLQSMIQHHEGAIVMVETLLGGGEGGQESEVFQLASHIASDQAVGIASMKRQLARMGA